MALKMNEYLSEVLDHYPSFRNLHLHIYSILNSEEKTFFNPLKTIKIFYHILFSVKIFLKSLPFFMIKTQNWLLNVFFYDGWDQRRPGKTRTGEASGPK